MKNGTEEERQKNRDEAMRKAQEYLELGQQFQA